MRNEASVENGGVDQIKAVEATGSGADVAGAAGAAFASGLREDEDADDGWVCEFFR